MVIIALALAVSHLWQFVPPMPENVVEYTKAAEIDTSIEAKLAERARELYKENEQFDLERYRQEAIRELNTQLTGMLDVSPFVDYPALKEKYGY